MLIFLVRGYSGAGKDFFGKSCVNDFGFERFAFADSLKEIVADKYSTDISILHSQEGKRSLCPKTGTTWRDVLLKCAEELRSSDPNIFAEMCARTIQESTADRIVLTDWRYPNEKEIIESRFPNAVIVTIHIKRTDQLKSPVKDISEHLLENQYSDFIILNNGYENLRPKIKDILYKLNQNKSD